MLEGTSLLCLFGAYCVGNSQQKKIPVVAGEGNTDPATSKKATHVLDVCLGAANFNRVVALKAKARNSRHPHGTSAALPCPTKGLQVLGGYC